MDQIQASFEEFHSNNPHVYGLWDLFTLHMIKRGFQYGGAGMIAERIRWYTHVEIATTQPVKLNNNYRSRYARLWMKNNPSHGNFFRTRVLAEHSVDSTAKAEPGG